MSRFASDTMDVKEYKKGQRKNELKLTPQQQIKKYYVKSLYAFGFEKIQVQKIVNTMFKNEQTTDIDEYDGEDSDSSESFFKEMTKQQNRKKNIKESVDETQLNSEEITMSIILLLIDINKWFLKNNEFESSLGYDIKKEILSFRERLNNLPNLFSIPKDSTLPSEFINIFSNLGLVPQQFNLNLNELGTYLNSHITALNDIGVTNIVYNSSIIMMASNLHKRQIAICHNKLLNLQQSKQKLTAFIIGCSMVSKPPKKISFLPNKLIDVISQVYPTIGNCVKGFNSKKGSTQLEIFNNWAKTELGNTLLNGNGYDFEGKKEGEDYEHFQPKDDVFKTVIENSWNIFTALYNTMTNRNCFSKTHVFTDSDGKRIIFPFMPVDFIKQISYSFPIDLFKSSIDEMSDHRFISTTFMMSMIMTLLIIAITNPSKQIYGYFYWITQAINDYHSHISPIKGESKESKNERIMVANKALYEVIEYMNAIINKSRAELILTESENKLYEKFFDGIYNLFPENKTRPRFNKEDATNTTTSKGKGTDQYFNDNIEDEPTNKTSIDSDFPVLGGNKTLKTATTTPTKSVWNKVEEAEGWD